MDFQVEIEKIVPPGDGLGHYQGKAVFVSGTAIGDVVSVRILKEKKQHIIAALVQVICPGENRVEASCPHYHECGGCSLMHLAYNRQLDLKRQILQETFSNFQLDVVPSFQPSPQEFHFRYRSNVKLEDNTVGFAAKYSHRLVAIPQCKILSQGLIAQLPRFSQLGRTQAEFSLLESLSSGDISISISEKGKPVPLPGYPSYITENYGWGEIRLHSDGFAQSNPLVTTLICNDILSYLGRNKRIYELYCGCGTFSIALAKQAQQVIGVDFSQKAIKTAKFNANSNRLDNCRFTVANLEKEFQLPDCDAIVVDPPRKGLGKTTLSRIGRSKTAQLVYVSCNPASLARDSQQLIERYGFRLVSLSGYDMYCHAAHIEALALFQR